VRPKNRPLPVFLSLFTLIFISLVLVLVSAPYPHRYSFPFLFLFLLLFISAFIFLKLSKKDSLIKNTPPPGYGVPSGYQDLIRSHNHQTKDEYGLYLRPGRINIAIIFLTIWLSIIIFTPFINEYSNPTYPLMVITYCCIAWIAYHFLFNTFMPVSLTQVWEKWPIPAYELFLSVPHEVIISSNDHLIEKKGSKKEERSLDLYQPPKHYIFWRPDKKTPMWRQSTESTPDMHTLQDLILNLAVFEFLFRKNTPRTIKMELSEENNEKNKKLLPDALTLTLSKESLREYNWYFFLFSPIVINLILILLSIFLFASLNGQNINDAAHSSQLTGITPKNTHNKKEELKIETGENDTLSSNQVARIELTDTKTKKELEVEVEARKNASFRLITHFPYNFVIAVLSWFLFTIYYVHWVLSTLTDLSRKIHQGYFNAQLDLIPQQILDELSYIPKQEQIDQGIFYVKKFLSWSSGIVFLGLMAMFEIFSQPASRLDVNYNLWESLISLFS
jgi:hypothetical protein